MGERARDAYLRRSTPTQRLDEGLRLSEAMQRAVLRRAGIPEDGSPESARRAFQVLRRVRDAP